MAQGDVNRIAYADGREVKLSYNPLRQLTEMEDWLGITKNIGKGFWSKIVSQDLDDVAKFFGASQDDVVRGFANAKTTGLFPKILNKIAYIGAFIDAGIGIKDNIEDGSTWQKTTSDAVVDVVVSGTSIWAAGAAGSAVGTAAGTLVPGVGNIVGAVAGFVIGIGIYVATDVVKINGKSIRDHIKDGISGLFGWG